jgi:hypothetical protein
LDMKIAATTTVNTAPGPALRGPAASWFGIPTAMAGE